MSGQFHVYTCARTADKPRLEADLIRSPELASGAVGLTVLWNQISATSAYARAVEMATADVLVFAHCDVYFPNRWFEGLSREVKRLSQIDPHWAVAGVSALTSRGELVGRIFDNALAPLFLSTSGIFGSALETPVPIESADELVLVLRRAAGASFDPLLPEFHLYGTDIILEAEKRGMRSYGLDLPVIHNAKPQLYIGNDYVRSYKYMIRKWRKRLPVKTTCGLLTSNPLTLPLRRLRLSYKARFRRSTYSTSRVVDPHSKALELGFVQLLASRLENAL